MTVPSVELQILDNQLGIRAPVDAVLAIAGTATAGDFNKPKVRTRIKDVQDEFASGPLVEACAYAIERYGFTVMPVRTRASLAGAYGASTIAFQGTSTPSIDTSVAPPDELDPLLLFKSGGTVGNEGITYQWSLDGGVTMSPLTALGAANFIQFPDTGGMRVNLSAGTIAPKDSLAFYTTAPRWTADELAEALEALRLTQARWSFLEVYGDMDSSALSMLDAKLEAMAKAGRNRRAMAHARKPDPSEDPSNYLDELTSQFRDSSSRRVALCAGYAKIDSSISRRRYRRPPSLAVAPLAASVSEEIDLAELAYGPLPGVFIRDGNGNPDEHDELVFPGLDDARFLTLRSWEGRGGVWVNNPRLFSPVGSDFLYLQYGRVIDIACRIAREELEPILSRGVFVIPDGSGRIEPETALSIEGQITGRLSAELIGSRKATAVVFTLSRTDDVLRTGELGWQVRVVPLAYIKKLKGTVALVASANSPATVAG